MGQRSRKRREAPAPSASSGAPPRASSGAPDDHIARGYARSRERDEAARAALVPLAPGERPLAVTLAAILAALLGAANLVLLAAGWEVDGGAESTVGVLAFAGLMATAAIGMWRCRYWAVLGFEALLGIAIVYASLALLVASNLAAVVRCVAIVAIAAPLFWFLIRAMARIQLPARRPRQPVG